MEWGLKRVHLTRVSYGSLSMLEVRLILYDFLVTVKAAPHECMIRTGQP